jgi:hypothetical protein
MDLILFNTPVYLNLKSLVFRARILYLTLNVPEILQFNESKGIFIDISVNQGIGINLVRALLR